MRAFGVFFSLAEKTVFELYKATTRRLRLQVTDLLDNHLNINMEDIKVDDEKNVGLLSSGYLESQKIVLPKDVFRNGFTWFCYETFKSLAFLIWLLSWLPVTTCWKMSTNWIYPFLATYFLILSLFFLPLIQMSCRRRAVSKQLTQFSKEISANSPGTDVESWETIAANLNSYMYENKLWKTKLLFLWCLELPRSIQIKHFGAIFFK
ncbi:Cos8p [Saccharomyces cerevisiae x Saccharomyces kudriavzevii VIN7]|uniref:Cos8p n=1 Tax=Saccharomyces cerevisiae x Saccharomyces kudriavzevii (strain VIN7) TaxID=1095631 RepID=H0GXV3_SACCK|nr:Cos8p [Saccharomyces cerevisiae x Saccharomyces kudriavzevii VIN7]